MKYKDDGIDRKKIYKRMRYLFTRNPEVKDFLISFDECPVCGEPLKKCFYRGIPGVNPHIRYNHPDYIMSVLEEKEKSKNIEEQGYICPLCNQTWINIEAHVRKDHNLSWEEFLRETGFSGDKVRFTENHKKKLSKNKLEFYSSKEGLELREFQRLSVLGDKNPACRDDVRQKISSSCMGRKLSKHHIEINSKRTAERFFYDEMGNKSFGYFFQFIIDDKYYYARSFEEYKIILSLIYNKINFIQEPCIIEYINEGVKKNYIPDFFINGVFFETKCTSREFEDIKYTLCKERLQKIGKDLRLLRSGDIKNELGFYCLSNEKIFALSRSMLEEGKLYIIKPVLHHGRYSLLEKMLGNDYDSLLEKYKGVFNENKERSSRENRRICI